MTSLRPLPALPPATALPLLRLFVALELPEFIKARLLSIQSGLRRELSPEATRRGEDPVLRWVEPAGIHLTLCFLGETPPARLPALKEALGRLGDPALAGAGAASFSLALDRLGAFPSLRRPRVVWVGLKGDIEELHHLQSLVEQAVHAAGLAAEERSFSPHLTLGRVREGIAPAQGEAMGKVLAGYSLSESPPWQVNGVSLMQSTLHPQGARYSRLEFWQLPTQKERQKD